MNRKGFTLVELVATIALLAVISIISFVSINGVINQSKVSNCNDLVNNIKIAVKEYVSDNRYKLENNNDLIITVQKLVDDNFLSSPIVNPFNNENIEGLDNIKVTIKLTEDYTVSNEEDSIIIKNGDNKIDCDSGKW